MSASLNKVFIMGNLTRDPELKHTSQGTAVVNISLAVNRSFKDSNGEFKKDVQFFEVVVWGKVAENCNKFLSKGRPILVVGRLQNQHWEQQDGQKRSKTQVIAEEVQFLGSGKADGNSNHCDDQSGDGENYDNGDDDSPVPF